MLSSLLLPSSHCGQKFIYKQCNADNMEYKTYCNASVCTRCDDNKCYQEEEEGEEEEHCNSHHKHQKEESRNLTEKDD